MSLLAKLRDSIRVRERGRQGLITAKQDYRYSRLELSSWIQSFSLRLMCSNDRITMKVYCDHTVIGGYIVVLALFCYS